MLLQKICEKSRLGVICLSRFLPLYKLLAPSLTTILSVLKELMGQELLEAPSLSRILDEALLNEVSESIRPLGWNPWHLLIDDLIEKQVDVLSVCSVRWLACCKLKSKAAVRPNVNFFGIGHTFCDFRRHPRRSAFLSLSVLSLL